MIRSFVALALGLTGMAADAATTLWSIGAPTDQEQYYLELINRARANPTAEGARLAGTTDSEVLAYYSGYNVNLSMMQSEMSALVVAAPLAMNAKLLQSSRAHSNDQFVNKFQGHTGTNGSSIQSRINAQGYTASFYAENVYAYSKSTWFGHAGFEVDWGAGTGGMQTGRGHRAIIHAGFREVGIGIREGMNGSFGPQVVTQDFGIAVGAATPFVTGVAYYDFNGNNFYDPGEGIGGVTVNVEGASYHAVTASSGGYAVPVPAGAATRTVTFSAPGYVSTATATLYSSNNNTKVDLKPAYAPPLVNGTPTPVVSAENDYSVSRVIGASGYEWRAVRKLGAAADMANDLTRVNTAVTGYSALNTVVKQEGAAGYHLAQPSGKNETLTYKATFHGGAAPSMQFQSRLAAANTSQKAYVQVSTDGGMSWSPVDTQTGSGGSGQSGFSLRSVPLTAVAGRDFMLRFNFTITGSGYNTGTNNSAGWFIDAVTFTDVVDTTGAPVTPLGGETAFSFAPDTPGNWILSARPLISGRTFVFGPGKEVSAIPAPPPPSFLVWAVGFEVSAGLAPGTLSLAPTADFNKDGVANLVAYALGLSPVSPSVNSLPLPVAAQGALRLDYPVLLDRTDVSVTPQVSSNLQTWFNPGQTGAPAGFSNSVISTNGNVQTRRASIPLTGQDYYLRLRTTRN